MASWPETNSSPIFYSGQRVIRIDSHEHFVDCRFTQVDLIRKAVAIVAFPCHILADRRGHRLLRIEAGPRRRSLPSLSGLSEFRKTSWKSCKAPERSQSSKWKTNFLDYGSAARELPHATGAIEPSEGLQERWAACSEGCPMSFSGKYGGERAWMTRARVPVPGFV